MTPRARILGVAAVALTACGVAERVPMWDSDPEASPPARTVDAAPDARGPDAADARVPPPRPPDAEPGDAAPVDAAPPDAAPADAAPPDAGPIDPSTREAGYAACARLLGCDATTRDLPPTVCARFVGLAMDETDESSWLAVWSETARCLAAARDCDDIERCRHLDPAAEDACGDAGAGGSACSGDRLAFCGGFFRGVHDCAHRGLHCVPVPGGARCAVVTCDPAEPPRCEGDVLVRCPGGVRERVSCPGRGEVGSVNYDYCIGGYAETCGEDRHGQIACIGTGEACEGLVPTRCEGEVLVGCIDGRASRWDCTARGPDTHCGPPEDVPNGFACVSPPPPCSTQEHCADGVITFCADGALQEVDCHALGFVRCRSQPLPTPVDGQTRVAFCSGPQT